MTYIPTELRLLVRERAQNRCEYCQIPEDDSYMPHEVDHIYASKHGGETTENNVCLSCWICNRHKGSDLTSLDPLTGEKQVKLRRCTIHEMIFGLTTSVWMALTYDH